MTVDAAVYVGLLDETIPLGSESKAEGDNNLRATKNALKTTFSAVTGAVTASHTEMNYLVGVTGLIQTQLNAKAPSASPTFTGSPVFSTGASFTVAPTWTTAARSSNDTSGATTEFVHAVVTAAGISATVNVTPADDGKYLSNNGTDSEWRRPAGNTAAMYQSFGGF